MSGKSSASSSQSEQYVKRPLIPEGDLSNISKDTCYLFVGGMFPMKLEKAWQSEVFGNYVAQSRQTTQQTSSDRMADLQVAATLEEQLPKLPSSTGGHTINLLVEEEWDQAQQLGLDFDESELEMPDSMEEKELQNEKEIIQKRLKEKEVTIQNFF